MMWLAILWAGLAALAEEVPSATEAPGAWEVKPYWDRGVRFGGFVANGTPVIQGIAGIEGGIKYRAFAPPHWTGRTRLAATAVYAITTQSIGGGLSLASFIGPDSRWFLVQSGPDIWFNGYGTPASFDYYLPWSPGVSLQNEVLFKVTSDVGLLGGLTPGWVLEPARRSPDVAPFHELTLLAAIVVRVKPIAFTIGFRRVYNGAGVIDGIIFSAG
jgi:hypothetical protein